MRRGILTARMRVRDRGGSRDQRRQPAPGPHGRPPPRGDRVPDHPGELVGPHRGPLRAGRLGDQRRRRPLPRPRLEAPRGGGRQASTGTTGSGSSRAPPSRGSRWALAARTAALDGRRAGRGRPPGRARARAHRPGAGLRGRARASTVERREDRGALHLAGRGRSPSRRSRHGRPSTAAGASRELLRTHETAWEPLWRRCDIQIEPADQEQLILRLHVFHVLQTHQPQPDRPRHRHAGPRLARRGLPRARLLGRGLHLPLLQPALPRAHPLPAPLPLPAPRPARAGWRSRRATGAPCSPGRAAATAGRRPRSSTSTRRTTPGARTSAAASATSTSPSPTTSGSTTWSPATASSSPTTAPR